MDICFIPSKLLAYDLVRIFMLIIPSKLLTNDLVRRFLR